MKKLIILSFVIFGLLSCNKDDNIDSTEYYVKYEVSCKFERDYGSYSGSMSIVINNTGSGKTEVKDKRSYSFSDIRGPFNKDDKVTLSVVTTTPKGSYYDIDAKMSVCKGSAPFVTKRSASAKNSVLLSYKIE